MNTEELKQLTKQAFAHSAYVSDWEGIAEVVGRWCRASYNGDGTWDVWVCNTKDLAAGLSSRRLNALIRAVEAEKSPTRTQLQRLTGEAVYPAMPTDTLLIIAPLLGVKKRRAAPAHGFKKETQECTAEIA